jgi:hypothetical protein
MDMLIGHCSDRRKKEKEKMTTKNGGEGAMRSNRTQLFVCAQHIDCNNDELTSPSHQPNQWHP